MVFKEKKSISKIQINIDILKNVTILGINFFLISNTEINSITYIENNLTVVET